MGGFWWRLCTCGVKRSFRLPFPLLLMDKALQCSSTKRWRWLSCSSHGFIFLYTQVHWFQFALDYSMCSWKYHLELGAMDLCCGLGIPGMSGFPKLPVLGARAAGEHGGVCSSGSNGIITWNWAGFVGIVEAIFDPEHANCLTMVFFPPLGLREQRYSVKTCCRYCNMLNMGVFFNVLLWRVSLSRFVEYLMWGKNTALLKDGTLDVFDFSAHKKPGIHSE